MPIANNQFLIEHILSLLAKLPDSGKFCRNRVNAFKAWLGWAQKSMQ
jgi:hypothetical protein